MTRRRTAHGVLACSVLLLSSTASAGPRPDEPPLLPAKAVDELPLLLRSTDLVAPSLLDILLPEAASTTTAVLPADPMGLSPSGIPVRALAAYRAAAARIAGEVPSCRLTWPLVAAIGLVESAHGSVHGGTVDADGRVAPAVLGPRLDGTSGFALISDTDGGRLDGDASLDRAVGPMQFIPSSWARHRADGDGDGRADPHDLDDAALAAGRYLCTTARRLDRPTAAIAAVFSYNHSYDYVRVVLTVAARYAGESPEQWGVDLLPPPGAAAEPSAEPSPETPPEPSADPSGAVERGEPADPLATGAPSPHASNEPSAQPSPESAEPEPSPAGEPTPSDPDPSPEPAPQPTEDPSGR